MLDADLFRAGYGPLAEDVKAFPSLFFVPCSIANPTTQICHAQCLLFTLYLPIRRHAYDVAGSSPRSPNDMCLSMIESRHYRPCAPSEQTAGTRHVVKATCRPLKNCLLHVHAGPVSQPSGSASQSAPETQARFLDRGLWTGRFGICWMKQRQPKVELNRWIWTLLRKLRDIICEEARNCTHPWQPTRLNGWNSVFSSSARHYIKAGNE